MKRTVSLLLMLVLLTSLLAACGAPAPDATISMDSSDPGEDIIDMSSYVGSDFELVALSSGPAVSTVAMPAASGTTVFKNTNVTIDASNTKDGYVMIAYTESTTARIKVLIQGPSGATYSYNLDANGNYTVFPLSDGNGKYTISVCKNVSGTNYSVSYSTPVTVALANEFSPFLLPNQYVNYTADSAVVKKAAELMAGKTTTLAKIEAVYSFVTNTFTYDYDRAASVQSGYLPNLDDVLMKQKGICFDYAAVMAAMLRSQGVPCKLVIGYAGTVYHAWINCFSESEGWMDAVIYFNGSDWKLMDPTFASTGNASAEVLKYIGNGSNYSAKYLY